MRTRLIRIRCLCTSGYDSRVLQAMPSTLRTIEDGELGESIWHKISIFDVVKIQEFLNLRYTFCI